jgi:hypothetical protein
MRKGFLVTLATVAIALMGFNAMALAPTIGAIPDIIVGDAEDGTDSNIFVYPDAISLDRYVSDDDTETSEILWSFSTATAGRYLINGVGPQAEEAAPDLAQFVNPTNQIDNQDLDTRAEDADPRTITIRDDVASPIASEPATSYPDPGDGTVGSQLVTLYASDGTTVSNPLETGGQFIIYTVDDAEDSYSPPDVGILEFEIDLTQGLPTDWASATDFGTVAITTDSDGLCLETQAAPDGAGRFYSNYGAWDLVKNCVYKLRLGVTADSTLGDQPLWQIVYDNYGTPAGGGAALGNNAYGGEIFLLDNEGGANSAVSPEGRSWDDGEEFVFWMMPPCFQIDYFQDETNGFFRPDLDPENDLRILMVVLDAAAAGIGAETDSGKICFKNIMVQRYDFSLLTEVGAAALDDDTLTNVGDEWGLDLAGLTQTTSWTGGNLTLTPTNWGTVSPGGLLLFRPGDYDLVLTDPGSIPDNYPVVIEGNTDYLIEVELSAPTQTDSLNNPDVIRLGASVTTEETVCDHFLTTNAPDTSDVALANRGVVMPREGGPHKYAILWNSLSLSNSAIGAASAHRMRPRIEVLSGTAFAPLGRTTNTGAITIHSVRIQQVSF